MRAASSAATASSSSCPSAPNAAGRSLSMSISPSTSRAVHDRHDDLRLRLDAARQIARIRVHVVDDDRRLLGGGRAADAAAERNARVRRRLADERAEHQLVAVEQVDADPGVVGHRLLQHADGARPSPGRRRVRRVICSRMVREDFVVAGHGSSIPSVLQLPEEQREAAEQRHELQRRSTVPCSRPNSTRRGSVSGEARRRGADRLLQRGDPRRHDDAGVDRRRDISSRPPTRSANRRGRGPSTRADREAQEHHRRAAVAMTSGTAAASRRDARRPAPGPPAPRAPRTSKIAGAATAPSDDKPPTQTTSASTAAYRSASIASL